MTVKECAVEMLELDELMKNGFGWHWSAFMLAESNQAA